MKSLFLGPVLLWFALPANSGIYYYSLYREGIEVRCNDGKPTLLVEIKSVRGMKLLGHGEEYNSWPTIYLYPEVPPITINTSQVLMAHNVVIEYLPQRKNQL